MLRTFPFLSMMGFIEELSFSSVFLTHSAVSLTVLSWCQHSVVVRRIRRILCDGVCVCVCVLCVVCGGGWRREITEQ